MKNKEQNSKGESLPLATKQSFFATPSSGGTPQRPVKTDCHSELVSESHFPNIRFAGFSDSWQEKKLGDVAEIGDIDHKMPKSVENGIPYLMTGDFINDTELNFENVKQISEEDYNQLSKKIKPEKGDILFARYATVGAVRYVETTKNFLISYSCAIIKTFKEIESKYLYQYLLSDNAQNQIALETKTGSQPNIGIASMKENIIISFPARPEQQKIGSYFATLDKKITAQKAKVEQLKTLKKYMLQNMFPQTIKNAEQQKCQSALKNCHSKLVSEPHFPKIRFAGFSDPWEEKKLGECLTINTIANGKKYSKEDVLSVSDVFGCVNQIRFQGRSFAGEDISNYKIVKTGDIIYTKSPLKEKPYGIIKIVGEEEGIVSPLYIVNVTKDGINSLFIYYSFDTPKKTNDYLTPLVRKGAKNTMNISNEEWLSGSILIPSSEEEQQKIGSYFATLDKNIANQNAKLEQLQTLKKYMLQNMFC